MFSNDKVLFLGLILPHGLLELTAVFVAACGRAEARLVRDRPGAADPAAGSGEDRAERWAIAIGLVGVLLISGLIEAFVTPAAADLAAGRHRRTRRGRVPRHVWTLAAAPSAPASTATPSAPTRKSVRTLSRPDLRVHGMSTVHVLGVGMDGGRAKCVLATRQSPSVVCRGRFLGPYCFFFFFFFFFLPLSRPRLLRARVRTTPSGIAPSSASSGFAPRPARSPNPDSGAGPRHRVRDRLAGRWCEPRPGRRSPARSKRGGANPGSRRPGGLIRRARIGTARPRPLGPDRVYES